MTRSSLIAAYIVAFALVVSELQQGVFGNDNPLSTHILDTQLGRPSADVTIVLYKQEGEDQWKEITKTTTDENGRASHLITAEEFTPGNYKFLFQTEDYFTKSNQKSFYPYVEIVFEVENTEEHYHVPLLLTAYGYSTYRGS